MVKCLLHQDLDRLDFATLHPLQPKFPHHEHLGMVEGEDLLSWVHFAPESAGTHHQNYCQA